MVTGASIAVITLVLLVELVSPCSNDASVSAGVRAPRGLW